MSCVSADDESGIEALCALESDESRRAYLRVRPSLAAPDRVEQLAEAVGTLNRAYRLQNRPYTVQKVALGATRDGKLTAILHDGTAQTSAYEEYTESLVSHEPGRIRTDSLNASP